MRSSVTGRSSATGRLVVLIAAMGVSQVGDRVATTALGLHAALTGSPGLLAAIFVADLVPGAVVGLLGGLFVDRLGRPALWSLVLLVQAFCYGLIAFTASAPGIVLLVAVAATATSLLGPAGTAFVHALAGERDRALAARLLSSTPAVASVAGPALGGVVFAVAGRQGAMAVDAVTFAVLAVVAFVVAPARESEGRPPVTMAGLMSGFASLTGVSGLRGLGVLALAGVIFGTSLEGVVGIFYLTGGRGLTSRTYRVVVACWAVGLFAGSVLPLVTARRAAVLIPVGGVVMGVCVGALPVFGSARVFGVLFACGGVGNGVLNAALRHVVFDEVPHDRQGRTWAAFGVIANTMALAGYLLGYAGERISVSGALVASGIVAGGFSVVRLVSLARGRWLLGSAGQQERA